MLEKRDDRLIPGARARAAAAAAARTVPACLAAVLLTGQARDVAGERQRDELAEEERGGGGGEAE